MKSKTKNRRNPHHKYTVIGILGTKKTFKAKRSTAKYPNESAKQTEYLDRKTKGYTKLLMQGDGKALLARLRKCVDPQTWRSPVLKEIVKIQELIASKEMSKSWKEDDLGFRLYYFENIPKKPFDLYLTLPKYEQVLAVEKRIKLFKNLGKTGTFTFK